MPSCATIINILEKLAPKNLAFDWDNTGIQIGDYNKEVKKILIALSVTEDVVEYAYQKDFDMVVAHHPLIFKPLRNVRKDQLLGKIIYKAIKKDITIYSAHTNLDVAEEGVNDILAHLLGLERIEILKETYTEPLKKIVVFVPEGYEDNIVEAMGNAGAGFIGKYSNCSFKVKGEGTFKPEEGANPFIGKKGKLEKVNEFRIETIAPENKVKGVINAVLKVHPYEEVAYDVYPMDKEGKKYGIGRIGFLKQEMSLEEFARLVKDKLDLSAIKVVGELNKKVKKIAVCGGAGSDLIGTAIFKNADVFVTGDVKYHDALDAFMHGIAVIDAGHSATEKIVLNKIKEYIEKSLDEINQEAYIEVYMEKEIFKYL
ncbi:Nif3-like dinuclear metal center hexameric protein [Thermovenabulum sp.]|uniref:Nif3-like dinuclear metal center hexameric protein n=1 Tax=Thermovenabulum sp. TaxID=3100335 RepID=UPI003C7D18BC